MQQCRVLCVVNWHFFESLTTLKLHCRFHCHKPFIAIPPVEILIPECSTVGQHTLLNPESLSYRNFSSTSVLNHITLYPSTTWYELICIQHQPKLVPFWACHLFAWKTLSWITVFLTLSFVTESSHFSSLNVLACMQNTPHFLLLIPIFISVLVCMCVLDHITYIPFLKLRSW